MKLRAMEPLHAVATGPAEGTPVVFLHGFMGSLHDWDPIIARLSHSVRCIAVDLPDHGQSRASVDYDFDDVARALDEVVRRFDCIRPVVVGYSMGGRMALYWALHAAHPPRLLVIESASPGLAEESARQTRREEDAARADAIERDFPAFVREWYSQPLFATLSRDQRDRLVRTRLRGNAPAALARSLRCLGTGSQPPLWDKLPQCTCPVDVVAGELDLKYAGLGRQIARELPEARLHHVSGAGHIVHLEQEEWFTALLSSISAQA